MARFDVLNEPWIPVVDASGEACELGMLAVFERAHALVDISCESPLESCALLRLLEAFAMDALQLEDHYARRNLYRAGRFDMDAINRYVERCRAQGVSFDLFDPNRPFMQAPYDPMLDEGKDKPIAVLAHALPSGNNHVHFDHRLQHEHALTPARAFRALLALQMFCTAGAQGYPSSVNNTPCVYVSCLDDTLFHALALNMLSRAECGKVPYDDPPVDWRDARPIEPKSLHADVSLLSAFSWMPRRVTLVPPEEGEALVRRCYIQPGRNFLGNGLWFDPHVAYKRSKKGELYTVKPQGDRALWRDVGAMAFSARGEQDAMPPATLTQRGVITRMPHGIAPFRLTGLATNQASYVDMMVDELSVPEPFFEDPELADQLRDDLEFVESAARAVEACLVKLSPAAATQAKGQFFMETRAHLFQTHLPRLAEADRSSEGWDADLVRTLDADVWKIALGTVNRALRRMGTDARHLIAQVGALNQLKRELGKLTKRRESGIGDTQARHGEAG